MPVKNTGVINSPWSQNLCNTWNVCISIPFIAGTSRKKSPSSYSHPNRVTSWPEAQDTAAGRAPQLLHPTGTPIIQAQSASSSWGRTQPIFGRAASTTELRVQMGITTGDEHWYARSSWLHQRAPRKPPTGTSILAARTFGLQHRHTLPKRSVLNYFWPRRKKAMSKRFLESDIATRDYRYYLCYRSTAEPQAQPEIPPLQMLYQRGNLTDWQTGIFLIAQRRKKNELSKKGVKKKGQLKARSPADSQWTTCQSIKPCASHAFWVQASKSSPSLQRAVIMLQAALFHRESAQPRVNHNRRSCDFKGNTPRSLK